MISIFRVCTTLGIVMSASTSCFAQLIGYWALDGDATATVGTSGTLMNGATGTTDRFGQSNGAILFDGVNDYISIAGGGGLDNLQTGTIAMWVRWDGAPQDQGNGTYSSNYGAILARQNNGNWSNDLIFLNGSDPATAKIEFRPYVLSSSAVTSASAPGDGVWRYLAITLTNGSQKLYLDGVLSATGSATGTIRSDLNVPLTIGAWIGDGASYFKGAIDDVKIYNTVLSASEIGALYAAPEPSTWSVIVGVLALAGAALRRRRNNRDGK